MKVTLLVRDFSITEPVFVWNGRKYEFGNSKSVETTYDIMTNYKGDFSRLEDPIFQKSYYTEERCEKEPIYVPSLLFTLIENINVKKESLYIHNYSEIYFYKNNFYGIDNTDGFTYDEIELKIKEHYYKHNEKFKKLQKEIELFESIDNKIENTSREPIPEKVRFSVWRRDKGKCVQCGSKKGLEFDHIIPFSEGGSNTERNLQLLCEKCNRQKSKKI